MRLSTKRQILDISKQLAYDIDLNVYSLLLGCCKKYKNNLIHMFQIELHHDFTNRDYIAFDKIGFSNRMKIKIPTLYRDEDGYINTPKIGESYNLVYIEMLQGKDLSSEVIAKSVNANPVSVRRIMSSFKKTWTDY